MEEEGWREREGEGERLVVSECFWHTGKRFARRKREQFSCRGF